MHGCHSRDEPREQRFSEPRGEHHGYTEHHFSVDDRTSASDCDSGTVTDTDGIGRGVTVGCEPRTGC